eukprot:Nk52_evm53s221 gene=Nk52_evmTU53s221
MSSSIIGRTSFNYGPSAQRKFELRCLVNPMADSDPASVAVFSSLNESVTNLHGSSNKGEKNGNVSRKQERTRTRARSRKNCRRSLNRNGKKQKMATLCAAGAIALFAAEEFPQLPIEEDDLRERSLLAETNDEPTKKITFSDSLQTLVHFVEKDCKFTDALLKKKVKCVTFNHPKSQRVENFDRHLNGVVANEQQVFKNAILKNEIDSAVMSSVTSFVPRTVKVSQFKRCVFDRVCRVRNIKRNSSLSNSFVRKFLSHTGKCHERPHRVKLSPIWKRLDLEWDSMTFTPSSVPAVV